MSPLSAAPAAAHDPLNCFHGHQEEGAWHAHYITHFTDEFGRHWNMYDHWRFEGGFHYYEHTRVVLCGLK